MVELTTRLQSRCVAESPSLFSLETAVQVVVGAAVMLFTLKPMWMFPAIFLTGTLLRIYPNLRKRRDLPPIQEDELYETLCALEPAAEARPESLRSAIPQLKSLSSRLGAPSSAVRVKARELLAKVHEATLHELPIAASSPETVPDALPIPGAAPEVHEVTAR